MNTKFSYTLVGAFVLMFACLLVGISLWLGFRSDKDSLSLYLVYVSESVSGLNLKAPVKYRGVSVGQVTDIALDPEDPTRVKVVLAVRTGTPIKTDTIATLSTQGITGIAFVELSGGTAEADPLSPVAPETVPVIPASPSLLVRLDSAVTQLISQLSSVANNTSQVVSKMNLLLESSNIEATRGILENVRDLTASFSTQVTSLSGNMTELSRFTKNAADVSDELPALVGRMAESVDALRGAAKSVGVASRGFDKLTR
ncbi:MAG: MlaD family protein, partial [Gammaproteobacteria bacterium]|nr:MlaD family protein [Gammaproteobacteria bacterium]